MGNNIETCRKRIIGEIMTKQNISIFIIVILIISTIFLCGCFDNKTDQKPTLIIYIFNDTIKNENITILVIDDNNEIYNQTVKVKAGESYKIDKITNKKGTYIIQAFTSKNRTEFNNDIKVNESYKSVHIYIKDDRLKIEQELK